MCSTSFQHYIPPSWQTPISSTLLHFYYRIECFIANNYSLHQYNSIDKFVGHFLKNSNISLYLCLSTFVFVPHLKYYFSFNKELKAGVNS